MLPHFGAAQDEWPQCCRRDRHIAPANRRSNAGDDIECDAPSDADHVNETVVQLPLPHSTTLRAIPHVQFYADGLPTLLGEGEPGKRPGDGSLGAIERSRQPPPLPQALHQN
jgi:hypothetical protein